LAPRWLLASRSSKVFLYGVQPTDPLTFVSVAIVLAAIALLACLIPAIRAVGVDPTVAPDNGTGPTMKELQDLQNLAPKAPPPSESDPGLASFAARQQACLRALGFTYPEGELRQQFTTTLEGRVGKERDFPGDTVMLQGMKKYANIPVPALVIFAIPHSLAKWVNDSTDPKVREAAKAFSAADLVLTTRQAKAFEDGVPTAHVVRLPGADHYVYISNEADVLREMKSFFSTLR
jgi:non-heme chloroperoxidase